MKRIPAGALGLLVLALLCTGCATTPPPQVKHPGPYPENYESLIERAILAAPVSPPGGTRTLTSATEPIMETRQGIDGWLVWAKVRENRPNAAGGFDIKERRHCFFLRDHQVLFTDFPSDQ